MSRTIISRAIANNGRVSKERHRQWIMAVARAGTRTVSEIRELLYGYTYYQLQKRLYIPAMNSPTRMVHAVRCTRTCKYGVNTVWNQPPQSWILALVLFVNLLRKAGSLVQCVGSIICRQTSRRFTPHTQLPDSNAEERKRNHSSGFSFSISCGYCRL